MVTLIRNAGSGLPECNGENALVKAAIDNRITEVFADFSPMGTQVDDFRNTVSLSNDPKIRTIKDATTFPIADIQQMKVDHQDCKYVRVYNGFDSSGQYVTFLVPLDENLQPFTIYTSSGSCCHCSGCRP